MQTLQRQQKQVGRTPVAIVSLMGLLVMRLLPSMPGSHQQDLCILPPLADAKLLRDRFQVPDPVILGRC